MTLCRSTHATHVIEGKYLLYSPYGQHNNQLVTMMRALNIAHRLNRTLIIPPFARKKGAVACAPAGAQGCAGGRRAVRGGGGGWASPQHSAGRSAGLRRQWAVGSQPTTRQWMVHQRHMGSLMGSLHNSLAHHSTRYSPPQARALTMSDLGPGPSIGGQRRLSGPLPALLGQGFPP